MNIREIIRSRRKAKYMTQGELAEGICSKNTITNFELGKTTIGSDKLDLLFDKLNLKIIVKQ